MKNKRHDKFVVQGPEKPAEPGSAEEDKTSPSELESYNEQDILDKLSKIQLAKYHGTNKLRSLDDLDALGSRTPKDDEELCKNDGNPKSIVYKF